MPLFYRPGTSGSHFFLNYNYKVNKRYSISNSGGGIFWYPKINSIQKFLSNEIQFNRDAYGRNSGSIIYYKTTFSDSHKKRPLNIDLGYSYSNNKTLENYTFSFQELNYHSESTNNYKYLSLNIDQKFIFHNLNNLKYDLGVNYIPVQNTLSNAPLNNKNNVYIINPTFQINYELISSKKLNFDLGSKLDYSNYKSIIKIKSAEITNSKFNAKQKTITNYADFKYRINNKIKVLAGIRYENYEFQYKGLKNKFNKPLYNIGVNYKIDTRTTISLNHTKRIQKPWFYSLIPINRNNNSNISEIGNPYLNPAISANFELGLTKYFNSNFVQLTPFYKTISSRVSKLISIEDNINLITTYTNLEKEVNYGFSTWLALRLFKSNLSINYGLDIIYKSLKNLNLKNSGIQFFNNLNITFNLQKSNITKKFKY